MTILPCPRSRTSHSWRAGSASCCMESLLAKMWGLPAPGRLLYQTRINQKPTKSKVGASGQGLLTGSKSAGRITTYGRATPIPRGPGEAISFRARAPDGVRPSHGRLPAVRGAPGLVGLDPGRRGPLGSPDRGDP